ncbi:MAG TPA: hypothetical protein DD491_06890 [Halieaceae bacterium]|nr:hypothetical protein [Halieaceae bacterium]
MVNKLQTISCALAAGVAAATVCHAASAESRDPGAFKIECIKDDLLGEPVRVVFERSMEYEDKYFGMGIGPRADSPVAYRLLEARVTDRLGGVEGPLHLRVDFESIEYEDDEDPRPTQVLYALRFFSDGSMVLDSASLSPDRTRLFSASSSTEAGANYRNCISVGVF